MRKASLALRLDGQITQKLCGAEHHADIYPNCHLRRALHGANALPVSKQVSRILSRQRSSRIGISPELICTYSNMLCHSVWCPKLLLAALCRRTVIPNVHIRGHNQLITLHAHVKRILPGIQAQKLTVIPRMHCLPTQTHPEPRHQLPDHTECSPAAARVVGTSGWPHTQSTWCLGLQDGEQSQSHRA